MWLLKVTVVAVVLTAKTCAQYGSSGSAVRGGFVSPYGTVYGGSNTVLYEYGMGKPHAYGGNPYHCHMDMAFPFHLLNMQNGLGYGGYPGVGGGLGSMTGYPGYGMGLGGMGYPGLGMQGYGGTINPYGPMMDYSSVYSGSTLGSPFWNLYGSSSGGFGTDTSLASLNRPFTTRQKESSKATAIK